MLEVVIGARKLEVEVDGTQRVRVAGEDQPCDWVRTPCGRYSLILEGKVFDLSVEGEGEHRNVAGRHGVVPVRIVDPRRSLPDSPAGAGTTGLQRVCAEMPGKVIRVLVRPGDQVAVDDSVLVLEAMKMQNEIRAPKSGTVKEVSAEPGGTVAAGDFLFSLE